MPTQWVILIVFVCMFNSIITLLPHKHTFLKFIGYLTKKKNHHFYQLLSTVIICSKDTSLVLQIRLINPASIILGMSTKTWAIKAQLLYSWKPKRINLSRLPVQSKSLSTLFYYSHSFSETICIPSLEWICQFYKGCTAISCALFLGILIWRLIYYYAGVIFLW